VILWMRARSRSFTWMSSVWPLLAITTSSESGPALRPALINSAVTLTPKALWPKPWSDTTMMLVVPDRPSASRRPSSSPTSASSLRMLARVCGEPAPVAWRMWSGSVIQSMMTSGLSSGST